MNIGEKAYSELFPEGDKKISVYYSNRFKPYNANVKSSNKGIRFGFSKKWEKVSEEIQIGLAQHLLCKVYKKDVKTTNMDLYRRFMERLPDYVALRETKAPPLLKESFDRINEEYFDGEMEMPNMEWGQKSMRLLGSFSYHTNTVRISTLFKKSPEWMLDYVVYHELLHKKFGLKYGEKGGCRHHPPAFRKEEAKFKIKGAEEKMKAFISSQRPKRNSFIRNIFK